MRKWILLAAGIVAITPFTSIPSKAQGVEVDVPGGGVRIGEPGYRRYHERDYDRPRFREREVRYGRGCRTVTVERDDGSMKRIRRCD